MQHKTLVCTSKPVSFDEFLVKTKAPDVMEAQFYYWAYCYSGLSLTDWLKEDC